jgi:hypothetical protein
MEGETDSIAFRPNHESHRGIEGFPGESMNLAQKSAEDA